MYSFLCMVFATFILDSMIQMVFIFMLLSQAECDELAQRAEALNEENASLRSELSRIRNEYDQLLAQNASLKVILVFYFFARSVSIPQGAS